MANVAISGDTSGAVTLSAPAVAGTTTLTLPSTSGTVLTTGTSTRVIPAAAMPAGSVLQVLSASFTQTQSQSASSWVDITNLAVTITPTSSTSKIFLLAQITSSCDNSIASTYQFFRFTRAGSAVGVGDANGSQQQATAGNISPGSGSASSVILQYLDSPATTSATTYKVQLYNQQSARTSYINRSGADSNSADYARYISTLTVMEVAV
jgi:hypothetical protein